MKRGFLNICYRDFTKKIDGDGLGIFFGVEILKSNNNKTIGKNYQKFY